jgi:hypothetical protein
MEGTYPLHWDINTSRTLFTYTGSSSLSCLLCELCELYVCVFFFGGGSNSSEEEEKDE